MKLRLSVATTPLLCATLLAAALCGCGQKGPLSLPGAAAAASAASAPASR
ncbi:LPS translocon maturation chaperone LptM [Aquabacterium sp.]|nr:lipoprotein [Aquabacterium sp.]HSW07104.1 lipoprotein [Aquabacterium sp.]